MERVGRLDGTLRKQADGSYKSLFELLPDVDRVKIVQEMLEWDKARGKFLFEPNEKGYLWFLVPAYLRWIFGGNRSGKSSQCCMDVIMQIEGYHPLQRENLNILAVKANKDWVRGLAGLYLDHRKWIKSPPVSARCVAVDFPNGVEKIVGPEYAKWLDRSMVSYIGYDNEKKRRIDWKNKSFLEFMSHDQDLDSHGGVSRDVIHFDEEPPSEIYQESMLRTLSSGGRMIGGMTAVRGITWTKDEIWDRYDKEEWSKDHVDKRIYAIKMRTGENPVNTAEMVQKISEMCLDDDERAIRLDGEFTARGGLVFREFKDRYPWVVKPFEIPERGLLIQSVDPHDSTPHGVVWLWVDYDGDKDFPVVGNRPNVFVIAELFQHATIEDLSEDIKMIESRWNREADVRLCDPSAWNESQKDTISKSTFQLFADSGLYMIKGSKDMTGGNRKVRIELKVDDEKVERPRLFIFDTCKGLRWEMLKYRYPDLRGVSKDNRKQPDRPIDKDDHRVECMRRAVEYVVDGNVSIGDMEETPHLRYQGQVIEFAEEEDEDEVSVLL
jgi:phage terminase large subunit-like protein